ncbi:unnamed protein product [Orchesella dallaii]|uniref:Uncharacterized protein n=1 Tax=Orchesella dallaii TaxID=48710 RepID=A0ABP1R8V1_9HEXA
MGLITSYYSGRKDHPDLLEDLEDEQPYHFRSHKKDTPYYETQNDYEDDGYDLRQDDIDHEYLREKVEISQMMEDLINEDKAEMESSEQPPSFMGSSAVGGSLLSSFLPFLGSRSMGKGGADSERGFRSDDRSKRIATPKTPNTRRSNRRLYRSKPVKKDPFWRVVNIWKKLKHRSQCQQMYPDCPFESWEIVRMLDLVKGQAKVLSAYLKITVDNVKPASMRN